MNLFFYYDNTINMNIILYIIFGLNIIKAEEEKINYLENLTIENYDINFNKNIYNYEITIDEEDYLNIDYELSDDNAYVCISGNGNFNKSDNVIEININNDYLYTIHAHKTIKTSLLIEEEVKEFSSIKKEIIIIFIIIISCSLIVSFYYLFFINRKTISI